MFIWERVSGKHHTMEDGNTKVIKPGDRIHAGRDTFKDDPQWKYIGPVEEPAAASPVLRKVPSEVVGETDKFDVLNENGEAVNDHPLTEEEADAMLGEL